MSRPQQRHGQIKNALMEEARSQGISSNDMYNRFFRELFLAKLMAIDNGWVLKGGTNLYCRIPGARHTQDLDLYRQEDPTSHQQAALILIRDMDRVRIGPYQFQVSMPETDTNSGTISNVQLTVRVFYGVGELSRFHIDVSGDLAVPAVTEMITVFRSDQLNLPFAQQQYTIRSYPIENQVADKVCAMFERHGVTYRPSTRYRDLYDIALIATELEIDAADLASALKIQQQVRHLTLPSKLHLPAPEWEDGYARLMQASSHLRQEITNIQSALNISGLLLDPLLANSVVFTSGTWSPLSRQWRFS